MAGVVVPFRGPDGKRRLDVGTAEARAALAHAMLEDVVSACAAIGRTVVVTSQQLAFANRAQGRVCLKTQLPVGAGLLEAEVVTDPGGGQGVAVEAGLAHLRGGPALVVNADLPCVRPRDLLALLDATPAGGIALVAAADGTTNALGLASPELFAPLYGPGSARRFERHARALGVACVRAEVPHLALDVDTAGDAERLEGLAGPRTQAVLESLRAGVTP